jgi:penicillin amidase
VDLAEPESSVFVIPLGESGNPYSEFFENYLDEWKEGEYLAMRTRDYKVEYKLQMDHNH